ncbi:hypothetical protein ACP4OV_021957 [Aristida adscensionis]
MKQRGFAPTLLMLPLGAALLLVLAAGLPATAAGAVSDDVDATIRLPSDGTGFADLLTAMRAAAAAHGGDEEKRPWTCCDLALCTKSFPPTCRCLDKVDRCSGACKQCEQADDDGSRYTCADWFHGDPGPMCHKDAAAQNGCGLAGQKPPSATVAAAAAREVAGNDDDKGEERRPWRCCDLQVCTKSWPPICHCWDVVERCSSACKRCEEVKEEEENGGGGGHGRRYRCLDVHRGDPGPRCGGRRHRGGTAMGRAFGMILRRGYGH